MDDAEAIRRTRNGDPDAFRVLVSRYREPIVALVRDLLPDRNDREDTAQEAFLRAYTALASFDPARGNFRAWLFRIARNTALNQRRKRRPRPMADLPETAVRGADPERREELFTLDRALAEARNGRDERRATVGGSSTGLAELTVPEDSYFLLGDARDNSLDSRDFGFVPREDVVGTPWFLFLPGRQGDAGGVRSWNRFGIFPGAGR